MTVVMNLSTGKDGGQVEVEEILIAVVIHIIVLYVKRIYVLILTKDCHVLIFFMQSVSTNGEGKRENVLFAVKLSEFDCFLIANLMFVNFDIYHW